MFKLKEAEKYSDLDSASEDSRRKRMKRQDRAKIQFNMSDSEDDFFSKIKTNNKYESFPKPTKDKKALELKDKKGM